jgi:hypothetical protein
MSTIDFSQHEMASPAGYLGDKGDPESLDLYQRKLNELPASIWESRSLRHLNLSGNRLAAIPERISELVNLEMLDLGHNHLAALPESLGQLERLAFLTWAITGCPGCQARWASLAG